MGISISGSNSISGLGGNDTDFDKVLENLKKIESTQLNRLEAWKSDWNLRYEAFTQIIEQIQAASSMLSQLSDKNNFVTKIVQSTNDGVVTAVANAAAQDVQHSVSVSQMASNAIWANGHVFDSKNSVINKTGADQYFTYIYAGEKHEFKVPPNTTLDSFASMLNNASDNPGIKVSLVQTGKGYMFQISGNDTGVDNDLYIFDSKLEGMSAVGSTSNWMTNSGLDLNKTLSNPTGYVFDIVLQNGAKKTIEMKGNFTAEEFVSQLNGLAGTIKASFDSNTNKLQLEGIRSISRRESGEDAYTPAKTEITIPGAPDSKLNAEGGLAEGFENADLLTFTLTMDDGSTRAITMPADSTVRDVFTALNQTANNGEALSASAQNGQSTTTINGVAAISVSGSNSSGDAVDSGKMTIKTTAASGSQNTFNSELTTASLGITFSSDKLTQRLDGLAEDAEATTVTFMLVDKNGATQTITMSGASTYQDLLDELQLNYGATAAVDASGNTTLSIANGKEFFISVGALGKEPGFETSLTATTEINVGGGDDPAVNLFYQDPATSEYTLEKAPDLVYTITTNEGLRGSLKMPSGSSMKDVLKAMQNSGGANWTWQDQEGNPVAAGDEPDLGVRFTDKDGNDLGSDLDAITEPVYLNLTNVQTVSGPEVQGQISSSSLWSIQRSSNAIYRIDNWPIEMESATNKITDVIEGVVFTLQDVGDARMSVSTDITSVEQSIQNFLDAVNSVLITINDLMKYDENKQTTSSDPNDIGNSNYSPSGLTNQKGSLLTGNYGVQLLKSRFSSMLGATPPGFKSRTSADDVLSGDVLASLANLGIKTDTDATSDTYGLLVLAPSSAITELQAMDKENYTNLITNNLEAVVDFFCAGGIGSSTSTDFRYGSHVQGITKPGSYDVTYSVTADGEIVNVMIGGEPAKRDESQPGNYFSVASGDPRGLSILIDDLTLGDHPPAGGTPMQVRIKQGLVQTTNDFLKAELVFNDVNIPANATADQIADAVHLKSQNGALMSLRDNYKKVMESIDVKIEREQRRIDTWYNRQKQTFANLETLLAQYSEQQKTLEGQLKQLSGNS